MPIVHEKQPDRGKSISRDRPGNWVGERLVLLFLSSLGRSVR
ncbi:hypothetical protein CKA32_004449 [Geitlerinema sp. FC II]|nr:hypothetical protein CKA32_004449 [Geitlerinema sp. FC II]